ncbi:hypothetical protein KBY72_13945 [Cyanobium sp. BA5m-21]|nr:hypothetical protein [Cyanobium sp. BA5m-10]MCP9908261.1 hypothetical protein [Cyanobium sp. BA5m-21]
MAALLVSCSGPSSSDSEKEEYDRQTIQMADKAYKVARANGKEDWEAMGLAVDAIKGRVPENENSYIDNKRDFVEANGLFEGWAKWEQENPVAIEQRKKNDLASDLEEARRSKEEIDEISSATGITNGAVLGVLQDLEETRNEIVTKLLDSGKTGPEVSAYLKGEMRPTIESAILSVGGSSSDVRRATAYVNQGIDANLNP